MCIKFIFVNLVDRLWVAGFAADAGITHDASQSVRSIITAIDRMVEARSHLHVKLAISFYRLCDQLFPALCLANVRFHKDCFAALLHNPFMRRDTFASSERLEISTD
jgi:hypothetical protein